LYGRPVHAPEADRRRAAVGKPGGSGLPDVDLEVPGPEGQLSAGDRFVLDRLCCLRGQAYRVEGLDGGLTNRNLKVITASRSFVVRISHPDSGLLAIDRDHEHENSLLAEEKGVGAPVVEYRPDLGALVLGFVEAKSCAVEDMSDAGRLERVIVACQSLHGGGRFGNDIDMFALHHRYLRAVVDRGFRLPDRYFELVPDLERVGIALSTGTSDSSPCHNDLLAGNCLDDGERVWLIDYEYAGNNDPCFEIGNLWSEADLGLDLLDHLLACYYRTVDPRKKARARLQAVVSQSVWMLWAAIQDHTATVDFDFWSWGLEKHERAAAQLKSRQLSTLLDLAGAR
jgi:thiamine kinase-like enzyme